MLEEKWLFGGDRLKTEKREGLIDGIVLLRRSGRLELREEVDRWMILGEEELLVF